MTPPPNRMLSTSLLAVAALLASALFAGCSSGADAQKAVSFSDVSGVYPQSQIAVTVTAPEGCTVAYTTDGSVPTVDDDSGSAQVDVLLDASEPGNLIASRELMLLPYADYQVMLDDPDLPAGRVLRAAVVDQGEVGEPVTNTYFFDVDFAERFPGCLVVSIVTDPVNLLDHQTGILVTGAVWDKWSQSSEAQALIAEHQYWEYETNSTQHGRDWERPCFVQLFDGQSTPVIEQDAGIRVTGGASRRASQKSFNIYFRDDYGANRLDYELFEGIDQYKSFRLRGGGNNTNYLKFKDAYLMELVSDRDFEFSSTRPAVVFLNGEYWGVYLLSEKMSDQMIADHCGVDPDQVVIIKEGEVEEGEDDDIALYDELLSYADRDLSDPATWEEFCNVMDVQSLADYCATRIYLGDVDWGYERNEVLWRTRDASYDGGRWRFILYDVEYSTGMYWHDETAAETDHLAFALRNMPLFAAAMRNPEFQAMFLEAIEEIGAGDCAPERTKAVMQAYQDVWEPLMPDNYRRYGDWKREWDQEVGNTLRFFDARYDLIMPIVREACGQAT